MNVNLNTIHQANIPTMPAEVAPSAQKQQTGGAAALSITHAAATPGEIEGANVPEETLVRNDPLGQLVATAFNLPPPPFPALPNG